MLKTRPVRLPFVLFVLLLVLGGIGLEGSTGAAQAARCVLQRDAHVRPGRDKWIDSSSKAPAETPRERTDRPMDVLRYDIDLSVTPDTNYVEGTVVVTFTPLDAPMDTVVFDLLDNMEVALVRLDGTDASWVHADDPGTPEVDEGQWVRVDLGRSVPPGEVLQAEIDYSGYPARSGLMGYRVARFPREDRIFPDPNRPVIATLSEDEGARGWWPCHDAPFDAAPVRLSVVGPEDMLLAGPGRKVEETSLGDGRWRQTWWMPAPIPAYLVSIAMARYVTWEDTVTVHRWSPAQPQGSLDDYPQADMRVEYYVDDLWLESAQFSWQNTPAMVELFETLWGPYPYADREYGGVAEDEVLKYGMALFVSSFAMEHPTVSSMGMWTASSATREITQGPAQEWAVAHELFHQWFGDAIRIERWGEIWLNEGMASYSEVVWDELMYGRLAGKERLLEKLLPDNVHFAGPILDPLPPLFGSTVYNKGAWVMHMLRQVMGRDLALGPEHPFIVAMRAYVTDPALRHGRAASTADFQARCEQVLRDVGREDALVGDSLDWFFVPWLTWEGRPDVEVGWLGTETGVMVRVTQPTGRVYRLPLPFRFLLQDGSTHDEVVWVQEQLEEVEFELPAPVVALVVDPEQDWLIDVSMAAIGSGTAARLSLPRPNPFPGSGTSASVSIPFFVSSRQRVILEAYDLRGRKVRSLVDRVYSPRAAEHVEFWDLRDDQGATLASGIYFVRMKTDAPYEEVRRVTYLK